MRRRSKEHGAAAVELALIVPMLLALMLGIIETSNLAATYQKASVCVRAGAREASQNITTTASVQSATNTCLTNANLSTVTPTISPSNPATAASGSKVTVSFALTYASWFKILYTSRTMNFTCSMIKER